MAVGPDDPVNRVRRGYDAISHRYAAARHAGLPPFLDELAEKIGGNQVLDAACGAGMPVAADLASRELDVTGLDISIEQLRLARRRGVGLHLTQGDLRRLPFRSQTFDAVVSTYAVFHVPRAYHSDVLRELRRVLRHPGYLLVTMGVEPWEGVELFHGVQMSWSYFGRDTSRDLIRASGFRILHETVEVAADESHAVFFAATDASM